MARRQSTSPTTPPGWRLTTVNGTRKAINPQGQIVAYNQYLNAQARRSGFTSHSDYRKRAKVIKYFRDKKGGIASRDLKLGSEGLRLLHTALFGPVKNDYAPGGAWAKALEEMGWRPKGATYAVGDTP